MEKKYYAIQAYENCYGGLHGMKSESIVEVNNRKQAEEIAQQNSIEIMESYSEIWDDIEEEAKENETDTTEIVNERIEFIIHELTPDFLKWMSWEEAEEQVYNDFDNFVKIWRLKK